MEEDELTYLRQDFFDYTLGDVDTVVSAVRSGMDPNAPDPLGQTPLHKVALLYQHNDTLRLLVEGGADVDRKDAEGFTPLMLASIGSAENVRALLKSGADPDGRNRKGATALHYAAINGDTSVIELLHGGGASLSVQDSSGVNPLMLAIKNGRVGAARQFILLGADVDQLDKRSRNIMHYAVASSHPSMLKEIVGLLGGKCKELIDQKSSLSGSLLMEAIRRNEISLVEELLALGARANEPTPGFALPVIAAASSKNDALFKLVLDKTSDESLDNYCKFNPDNPQPYFNGLPCLLIESKMHRGLKYLYERTREPLICNAPLSKAGLVFPPVYFALATPGWTFEDKIRFMGLIESEGFPLEPPFADKGNPLHITAVDTVLRKHTEGDCQCPRLLRWLSDRGVGPDCHADPSGIPDPFGLALRCGDPATFSALFESTSSVVPEAYLGLVLSEGHLGERYLPPEGANERLVDFFLSHACRLGNAGGGRSPWAEYSLSRFRPPTLLQLSKVVVRGWLRSTRPGVKLKKAVESLEIPLSLKVKLLAYEVQNGCGT